jgi:Holliday junction resolvase
MAKLNSRAKGKSAERELANLLAQRLGIEFSRNLDQVRRCGGFDLVCDLPLAIEIKRQETVNVSQWWKQARRQATGGKIPVLAYRQSRKPWAVVVPLAWLTGLNLDLDQTATISLDGFVELVQRRLISS